MLTPVVAACGKGGIVTKAGSGVNVGFAALAGVKHFPSILLDLQSFLLFLLDSVLLLFVGVVFFEKGEGLGLLGYLWAGEKGFIIFYLSSMYDSDSVTWSFPKLCIPLRVCTVISPSIVSSGRSQ